MAASAGVYNVIEDRSFVTSGNGAVASGIVISANRGPEEIKLVSNAREFLDLYGTPSRSNPSMYAALRYLNRAGGLYVRRVINDATKASAELVRDTDPELEIEAYNSGAWGNDLRVEMVEVNNAPAGVFGINVFEADVLVEEFEVSRDVDAKNGFGRSIYIEDVINTQSRKIRVTDLPNDEDDYEETTVNLTGGTNDTVAPSSAEIIQGWEEFENTEAIDIVFMINAGFADPSVQNAMLAIAETRQNSVAILDVPQDTSDDAQAMVEYRNEELGADTYFGALYGGWLQVYDQYNDRTVVAPPSGDVAAAHVIAITRGERWLSAFGVERGVLPNVDDTTLRMSQAQRDLLATNGINPVTKIGAANAVIFGQKTLQAQESGMARLNVVTNVLWINETVADSLLPFIGRPNTVLNRDTAGQQVSNFLESVQRRGGLFNFDVDVSDDINTAQDIDSGVFNIDLYIQPTRLMEVIRQRVIVTPTGVSLG